MRWEQAVQMDPVVTLAIPEGKAKVPVSSMPQDHSAQGGGQQVTALESRISPGHSNKGLLRGQRPGSTMQTVSFIFLLP